MKGISALLLSVIALSGCARLADTAQTLFVSTTPAVATVGSQLVQGQLQVYSDNTGFIALESDSLRDPILRCSGRLTAPSSFGREIDLRCSNGVQARLALSLRTGLRGFAYGGEAEHAVGLAFGLEPGEVVALLKLPTQPRLVLQDGRYQLTMESPAAAAGASMVEPKDKAP